ncbi:transposase [Chitinophaga silvisoli]|uniref:Transposase IS701-like DDE domain-containing protein n=1 Tax=Chitinophaga silvisoli TaxID=2291814 RepID=A0A3E1NSJ9_9BACT|nr:hypothetical protein DXN04_31995 [Chitinophaga silvisoli]
MSFGAQYHRNRHLLQKNGLDDDTCLIIDESGNSKNGKQSVGVKMQYCGQLGKNRKLSGGCVWCIVRRKFSKSCSGKIINGKRGK